MVGYRLAGAAKRKSRDEPSQLLFETAAGMLCGSILLSTRRSQVAPVAMSFALIEESDRT
jgi:hypothetical protein